MATISAIVYYTPMAAKKIPDVEGHIGLLVNFVNRVYRKSKVPITLSLHCTQPLDISESPKAAERLHAFKKSRGKAPLARGIFMYINLFQSLSIQGAVANLFQSADMALLLTDTQSSDAGGMASNLGPGNSGKNAEYFSHPRARLLVNPCIRTENG